MIKAYNQDVSLRNKSSTQFFFAACNLIFLETPVTEYCDE
jgi:hypothetical protein